MKTLVFIGGWARSRQTYHKLLQSCPDDWDVIVIPYSNLIPGEVDGTLEPRLRDFLDSQGLIKVSLAGHSLGGEVCIEFASRYPARVQEIFLIDSCGVKEKFTTFRLLRNFLTTQLRYGICKLREDAITTSLFIRHPLLYLRLIGHFYKIDLEDKARQINVPTTIFWGENDYLVTARQVQRLHAIIPGSQLNILKGKDHDWIVHSPSVFWKSIIKTS